MKLNYGMISVAALALGLGACSKTTPIETTIQKIEEPKPIINTKDVLYKTAKVKSATSIIPTWYKKLPKEENIIYTVGSATSPNLQLAVDMATLNAKYTLADRINGKLDAMMKTFTSKIGSDDIDSSVLQEIEKVSKNVIASVDVNVFIIASSLPLILSARVYFALSVAMSTASCRFGDVAEPTV